MSKLQRFNGGLATRRAPQLIQTNEAVQFNNIDTTQELLAPVKDKLSLAQTIAEYMYYYEANSEWLSSAEYRDYIEYQKVLYTTGDDTYIPQRYDGDNTYRLGIMAPELAPTIAPADSAPASATFPTIAYTKQINIISEQTLYNIQRGIWFNPSRDLMFILLWVSSGTQKVHTYSLSTAGDISTAT